MKRLLVVTTVVLGLLAGAGSAWAKECVDADFVLAMDISKSINRVEHQLQTYGYASALVDPDTVDMLTSGPCGATRLTIITWAGPQTAKQVTAWVRISSADSARVYAGLVASMVYSPKRQTVISDAIKLGTTLLKSLPERSSCQAILVSGDGGESFLIEAATKAQRDMATAQNISVDGLPLMIDPSTTYRHEVIASGESDQGSSNEVAVIIPIDEYYETFVVGGPKGFLQRVNNFSDVALALRKAVCLKFLM